MTITEQARLAGLNPSTVFGRIYRGYSLAEALTKTEKRTIEATNRRKEVLSALGWDTNGLSTGAVWLLWDEVLTMLHRNTTLEHLEEMIGFTLRFDIKRLGLSRQKGWRNPKKTIEYNGERLYVKTVAKRLGISYQSVYQRDKRGTLAPKIKASDEMIRQEIA